MKKYEELYNLSKEVFAEEITRFERIDSKAAKYFTVLLAMMGLIGVLLKWLSDTILPPSSGLEWLLLIVAIVLFVSIAISWFLAFSVLRIHELKKQSINSKTIQFFRNNNLVNIYYGLARLNAEGVKDNRKATNRKSRKLYQAYWMISITMLLLVLLGFLFIFYACTNNSPP